MGECTMASMQTLLLSILHHFASLLLWACRHSGRPNWWRGVLKTFDCCTSLGMILQGTALQDERRWAMPYFDLRDLACRGGALCGSDAPCMVLRGSFSRRHMAHTHTYKHQPGYNASMGTVHEFAASKYFVRMMLTHPWRTFDPADAEVFIIPKLGIIQYHTVVVHRLLTKSGSIGLSHFMKTFRFNWGRMWNQSIWRELAHAALLSISFIYGIRWMQCSLTAMWLHLLLSKGRGVLAFWGFGEVCVQCSHVSDEVPKAACPS